MKNNIIITIVYIFGVTNLLFSQNYNGVCVGINDWPGTTADRPYLVEGATAIRQYLINYKQWDGNRIQLLTNSDAGETSVLNAIGAMSRENNNINLLFYAGHGDSQELGGTDGLIPPNDPTFQSRITPYELSSNFGSTFNQYICFIEACGSGIFKDDINKGVIVTASKAEQLAWIDSTAQLAFFTKYLLQGLTQSNIYTAEELYSYASSRTTNDVLSNLSYYEEPQIKDNFPGYLSIFNSSITLSDTLTHHETWCGSLTLQGDVFVPSNVTLTLSHDLVLNLNNYSIVSIGGTIMNDNANLSGKAAYLISNSMIRGYCGSIYSAGNNCNSGNTIEILSGEFYNNMTISNKNGITIQGQGTNNTIIYGTITATNTSNLHISDLKLQSGGLSLNNCSTFNFLNLDTYQCSTSTLAFYGSTGQIYGSISLNSSAGIYCNDTDCYVVEGSEITSEGIGVWLQNTSLGNLDGIELCNNTWDIYTDGASYGYGDNSAYSGNPANTTYGNVTYNNYTICS